MGKRYWIQVGMMVLSLGAILWVMANMQKAVPPIAKVMGHETRPAKVQRARVDLCETRVQGLKTASGVEFFENGLNWYVKTNSNEKKLDNIEVEKWFGRNCSVYADDLRPVASNDLQAAKPILTFNFIQGGSEAVKKTAAGDFVWRKIIFHSSQLEKGLEQLAELKEAKDLHARHR
jgi:hypothetical protein